MRKKLIELRSKKNMTQKMVANELNISRGFYSMIENDTRNPTLKLANKIANFFNSSVNDIFFEQ